MGNMRRAMSCRILVVDDNPSVHETTLAMFQQTDWITGCGTALEGREGIQKTSSLKPDIVLMDVNMPGCDGIQAAREIIQVDPTAKILFYSAHPEAAYSAVASGAIGFVIKEAGEQRLQAAIQTVFLGGTYFDPLAWAFVKKQLSLVDLGGMSDEKQQTGILLMRGNTSKEIAAKLNKSQRRIEKIRAKLMEEFGVKNAAALVEKLSHLNFSPELKDRFL